ncbi:MDR family MFS transporter [Pseudonocardia sp. Cha107L01]|uniref:MDR family MFS transporter n=1 Tax=Pseudonocardia sp. Cha107L01 TaxID=3457576 RepID=UPI00403E4B66
MTSETTIGPRAGDRTAPDAATAVARRPRAGTTEPVVPPPSPAPRPTPPAPRSRGGGGWLLPVLVLVVGNFMAVLDVTIVNVAVPAIQKDFGGSLDDVLWIATAYTLMLGVVVPVSSWLGERFGLARVYVWSLAGFAVGSALCGLAGNLGTLIVFRVLQAIPGGIMPVVAMTLLYRIVPRQKLGTAMGIFGLGIIFAPAAGPVLGGYFVQYLDWRLVFYVNVPVGLLGAVAAVLILPKLSGRRGRSFDVPGFLCIAGGLFAVLLAASEGSDWGWDGYRIRMLLVGGVLGLALFVVVELHVAQPLLDIRVFKVWPFTSSLLMLSALQMNLLGISFFVPVFLQQGQQKQAFDAGILMLPSAVLTGLLMPMVGKLYDKIGPRWLGVFGLTICAYGTYLMSAITPEMTRTDIIFWTSVRGIGLGLSIMPIMTAGLAALPAAQTNEGSALNNVARQTAGALGLAVLSAISTSQQAQLLADRGTLMPAGTLAGDLSTPGVFAQLYGRYEYLSSQVLATSYANLFLVIAAVTGAGVLLAIFMRKPDRTSGPAAAASAGH